MLPPREGLRQDILDQLKGLPGIMPMMTAPWAASTFWMYTILVNEQMFGMDSRRLMQTLDAQKIQCRPLWQPIHQSPAHAASNRRGDARGRTACPEALSLPCSVGLTESEQDRVIAAVTMAGNRENRQMSGTNDCHRCGGARNVAGFTIPAIFLSGSCAVSSHNRRGIADLSSRQPQSMV